MAKRGGVCVALQYDYEIVTFVKKYDISPRLIPQVSRYQELMLKEAPTPAETEELNQLAVVLAPYNITANDYNRLFQAVQNMQMFIKVDIVAYLEELFAGYDARMLMMEQNAAAEIQETNAQQTAFQSWIDGVRNNIVALQSFYFQNWAELEGCVYKEYPKDDTGKFIVTISSSTDGKLFARQTEWATTSSNIKCYWTKQEVFEPDGATIMKEKTKKEYRDASGVWIGEVV